MKVRLHWLVLCLAFLATIRVASAEKPWIEVRSPHFRVLANGSPADARHVAHEFEQMRYVFATQFPLFRLESGAPLTIFAARDEGTAKALEPGLWKLKGVKPAGVFDHSWERQYVMVRLDVTGLSAHAIVYHEYTHSILHINTRWLPTWLDEGMAEFYGSTRFQPHQVYIGSVSERYPVLQGTPIPIKTLIGVDPSSPYYRAENRVDMFYAESWVVVHYMIYGQGMEHGAKLNQFFALLQQGKEQDQAFQQVFGDFADFDKKLDAYMQRLLFSATLLKDPSQIDDKDFSTTTLSMAQTEAELAGFHLWNGDLADAGPLVEKALKDDPKLGLAHEEEGFLLFAYGQDAAAAGEFSKAVALDGSLYLSLFAKTMLSPIATSDVPADQAAYRSALMKVVDLNRQFAPAYVELAQLAVRQNQLAAAIGLSRRAEELEPSRAGYHLLTGQILLRMGKDAQAANIAQFVAQRWSGGADHDEAVELWNRIPAAQRPAGKLTMEQFPKGTQTIAGTVKSVSCGGPAKEIAFVLMNGGHALTFRTKGYLEFAFSDTFWYGADHFSFCYHLDGVRAVMHYRAASDSSYAGDIVEIDIRDDLPASANTKSEVQQAATP